MHRLQLILMSAHMNPREPDLGTILDEVKSGTRPATLTKRSNRPAWVWLSVVAAAMVALWAVAPDVADGVVWVVAVVFMALPAIGWLLTGASAVGDWWSSTMNFALGPYGSRPAPKCHVAGCDNSASYEFDPAGKGAVALCHKHKERVEHRARYEAFFRPGQPQLIVSAYQDLQEASKLAPHSRQITENLEQARQMAEIVLERDLPH